MAERRRIARESGLCITCCIEVPAAGHSTCAACIQRAAARVRRKRSGERAADVARRLAANMEVVGDAARDRHLFEDASHYYAQALETKALEPEEGARVAEKLAATLAWGRTPRDAQVFLDRVWAFYRDEPATAPQSVQNLLQKSRILHLNASTPMARALVQQAIRIAEGAGAESARRSAVVTMVSYLLGSGKDDETDAYLGSLEPIAASDDPSIQLAYYRAKALLAAVRGNASGALDYFDCAIAAAEHSDDFMRSSSVWLSKALFLMQIGHTGPALECSARAVAAARRLHIDWLIPVLCLGHAGVLIRCGDIGGAHEALAQALRYDSEAQDVEYALLIEGLPIALYAGDDAALARCARPDVFERLLVGGLPQMLGGAAASFAAWHASSGRAKEARRVLHRSMMRLAELVSFRSASAIGLNAWEFPLAVARFGAPGDFQAVREIVKARTAFTDVEIPTACLFLFDAFVAKRRGGQEVAELANEAHARFSALGWKLYADIAQTLAGPQAASPRLAAALSEAALTSREREVAELALQGFTNRAIAAHLAISENTVESHMRSIFNRLGLRSRHQLIDLANQ
jgi:DNA-binding CsgD family transcriptional regulator/tetratricopeptide (TPR) repeat protein